MLCGYQPFSSKYVLELIEIIKQKEIYFECDVWDRVSPTAKDLIGKLLEKDPNKRLTIVNALRHKWFNEPAENLKQEKYSHVKFKANLKRNQRKLTKYRKKILNEMEDVDEIPGLLILKVQNSIGPTHFYSLEDIENGNFSF